MMDQLIRKVSQEIELTSRFDEAGMRIETITTIAGRVVHTHSFDLLPIYAAFARKMDSASE